MGQPIPQHPDAAGDGPSDWIVEIGRCRDRACFERLFLRFAPKLKAFFLRNGLDDGQAEDLSQDVLLQVWRKADLFDPDRAQAWSWIYAIARNLWIDRRRRLGRIALPDAALVESPSDPEAQLGRADEARHLRRALQGLPSEQIAVVRLAYYDDRPHSEIARRLGLPLGTVKSRLRRAAARLRVSFDE